MHYICSGFFENVQSLYSVVLPNNSELRSIGPFAFSNTSISSITIPSHVTEIGERAFSHCLKLQYINFSDDSELRSIGESAFSETSIETITIPLHVTEIGNYAFRSCSKLQNIVISYNLELRSIGKEAIPGENLDDFDTILIGNRYDYNSKVTIPSNVKYIYPYSYYGSQIKEIEFLPNSKLLSIGDYAFGECNITSCKIPKHVIKIGSEIVFRKVIFEGGSKLSLFLQIRVYEGSITISSYLRPYIIVLLKKYNDSLKEIIVHTENKRYKTLGNIILYKSKEDSHDFDVLLSESNTSSLAIPSSIKYIFPYCFFKCNLQKIEFSEDSQLLSIGEYAFSSTSIETIKIPPHVTKIDDYAFKSCINLINVVFPNNSQLLSIGEYAFSSTSIGTITIPPHVTEIGDNAFDCCRKLGNVDFPNNSELRSIGRSAFSSTSIGTITILPHVTGIANSGLNSNVTVTKL